MRKIKIAWWGKHFGEEPPLIGNEYQGTGAIFFSGCNLKCVFCQNYQISQSDFGQEYSINELVRMMLDLQARGVVSIDLVTPTIWWQQLKTAIPLARQQGLTLPIVWNSNGYDAVNVLRHMEGLVDIYLPDYKYGEEAVAVKYSSAFAYPRLAAAAVREMLRQVGLLQVDGQGIARQGLIVRHLILPNHLSNSLRALEQIAQIDKNIAVSLMWQYYPVYRANEFSEINCFVNEQETQKIFDHLWALGLENGWTQESGCQKNLAPNFYQTNPFKSQTANQK